MTVVKAFDFACPYCANASPMMSELVSEYGGKLRVVYKNMVVHKVVMPAHLASCAAAKQGIYLAWKAAFWDKGYAAYAQSAGRDKSLLAADHLLAIGRDVGLEVGRMKVDMDGPEGRSIEGDQETTPVGVRGGAGHRRRVQVHRVAQARSSVTGPARARARARAANQGRKRPTRSRDRAGADAEASLGARGNGVTISACASSGIRPRRP